MDALYPPHPAAGLPLPADDGAPLPERMVQEAVQWYVRLASGQQTQEDMAGFTRWHTAHPGHARAWERLLGMQGMLVASTRHGVAPEVARTALARAARLQARRRAMKALAWGGVASAAALVALEEQAALRQQWHLTLADERTAVGERRRLALPDGTQLLLNTGTAVDIRLGAHERRVVLHRGEIQVATARDPAGRPFIVATRDGTLTPVGTRFTVLRDEALRTGATRLAVSEGAVQVRAAARPADEVVLVPAGRQLWFTSGQVEAPEALRDTALSWTEGTLTAEGTPLADFIAELDRYRPGRLRCAPEVAGLRITGAWPLEGGDPTERVLASLERTLPVRVHRLTRYWVTVAPRTVTN